MMRMIAFSKPNKLVVAVSIACWFPDSLYAADLKFVPSVSATGYVYDTKTGDDPSTGTEAVSVSPKLVSYFTGKRANGSLVIENTTVEQSSSEPNTDKSFTELSYSSGMSLIENVLSLSLAGSQNYRVIDTSQSYISDKVLSSGDLSKVSSHNAQLSFVTPNPHYIGLAVQSGYSKTKSNETLGNLTNLNSEGYTASAQIYQGRRLQSLSFLLSSQFSDTKRESTSDLTSTLTSANIGFKFTDDYSLILTATDRKYDIDENSITTANRQNLDTTSYGAGVRWQPSDDRFIDITYNNLDEGDNNSRYVGLNTQWAFSKRTFLGLTYDKNFYGDAYDMDFAYKLKSFKTKASYSESVTSYSRLSIVEGVSSLFVCPIGSTEFAECFQPTSIDYVLQAGEEFRSLNSFTTDITDETLFRKSGQISFGYNKRRLSASLNLNYNRTEYLESAREQDSRVATLNLAYELGRRNDISLTTSYSTLDYSDSDRQNDVLNIRASFTRALSRDMKLTVAARYVDRETEDESRDITDSRLTVSVNYQF